jgi:antitoxin PrlF
MSYDCKITSKGQITLPAELRDRFDLNDGDKVEFYVDHAGRIIMRPRNAPATRVFEHFKGEVMVADTASDDDAIQSAVVDRDRRSQTKSRGRKSAA